jgi:uncharacterized YigZ family protein
MKADHTYKTIYSVSSGEFREKSSLFMAFAYPVSDEDQVKAIIQEVKKSHPKANHHCYAFRLGPAKSKYRYADDREPSGSAGKPIFGVIQSNDLTDILIVVVRYFGGSLLGVPGLIRAYRSAAADAIKHCIVKECPVTESVTLTAPYESLGEILELIRITGGSYTISKTGERCELIAVFPLGLSERFTGKIVQDPRYSGKYQIIHG